MMKSFKRRKPAFWIALALLFALAGLAILFVYRDPVVMVSDNAFNALYGQRRVLISRIKLSLRCFRRIKTVNIVEGAGADIVALGVENLSRRPWAAVFPYRYRDGAEYYLRDRPDTDVVILAGRIKPEGMNLSFPDASPSPGAPGEGGPRWFFTDMRTDLYRAGLCAAFIARRGLRDSDLRDRRQPIVPGNPAGIGRNSAVLYYDDSSAGEKEAFSRGLRDRGLTDRSLQEETPPLNPVFPGSGASSQDASSLGNPVQGVPSQGAACAVLAGRADAALALADVPLVLFTWTDPFLLPRATAVVFDDSPWAQLEAALDMLKKDDTLSLIPSKISLPKYDKVSAIDYKDFYRSWRDYFALCIEVYTIKKLRYQGENTDN